jgi:cytidylate kinase
MRSDKSFASSRESRYPAAADEDAGRADYSKRFYGIDRELPTHFDVVVNTDILTPHDAANIIVGGVA